MVSIYNKTIVKNCAVNKLEFNKASLRLKCKKDKDNSKYMCLPNSDRTALFEFCIHGKIPGLQLEEHCPYIHTNEQLNAINCTTFVKGCPKHHYSTFEVYRYPACLSINKEKGCYKAEPKCSGIDDSGKESVDYSTSIYIVSVAFAITAIMLIIACIWIVRTRKKNDGLESQEQSDALMGELDNNKKASDGLESQEQSDALMGELDNNKKASGTEALPDSGQTSKLPFNMLLTDIVKRLSAEKIQHIRDIMTGHIGERTHMSDMEFFTEIADRFNLGYNIMYLQAILERISQSNGISHSNGVCGELVKKCSQFAEKSSDVLYLEREDRPAVNGFNDLAVHIKGRILSKTDIERVRSEMALILEMDTKYVLYRGGEETESFLLKFMVPEEYSSKLQDKEVIYSTGLCEIGVDLIRRGEKEMKVQISETTSKSGDIDPWKASRTPSADYEPAVQTRFSSPAFASLSRISKPERESFKEDPGKLFNRAVSVPLSGHELNLMPRDRNGSF